MVKKKEAEAADGSIRLLETFTDASGIKWTGVWTGVRMGSAFVGKEVTDKRGITETLKRRVRGEAKALELMKEAYRHPITPDAETSAKHRLPPSERRSPFEWGTMEWYRNELALAQGRIRQLEDECDRLIEEKRERDSILLEEIERPGKGGSTSAESKKAAAADRKADAVKKFKSLIASGYRDAEEAMTMMIRDGWAKATLYRHLKDELARLGRGSKRPVKKKM